MVKEDKRGRYSGFTIAKDKWQQVFKTKKMGPRERRVPEITITVCSSCYNTGSSDRRIDT